MLLNTIVVPSGKPVSLSWNWRFLKRYNLRLSHFVLLNNKYTLTHCSQKFVYYRLVFYIIWKTLFQVKYQRFNAIWENANCSENPTEFIYMPLHNFWRKFCYVYIFIYWYVTAWILVIVCRHCAGNYNPISSEYI